MPYCKFVSIHTTVGNTLRYILNPDKTEELLYADSMNCFPDAHLAYMNMKAVYEHYSGHRFNAPKPKTGNGTVKAIHIIQSFSPDDKVTPEQVHEIGMELVRRLYGDKAQAVITTHLDKAHLHNHICVCCYTLDGKKLNNNLSEILRTRDLSDDICIERGIIPIMLKFDYEKGNNYSYAEWKHRKKGTSWKAYISQYIDSLIPLAKDFDELLKIMEAHGYTIKRGMYISVKAPDQKRAVRLHNLGIGYSEEELINRINDYLDAQPKERTLGEIFQMIQRDFERETRNICFAAGVKDMTGLLMKQNQIINGEHIHSIGEAEGLLEQSQKKITELETAVTDLSADIQHKQIVASAAERYFGKHKFGEYAAAKRKADKLILANAGVNAFADVSGYADDIAADNERLKEMQSELEALKQREAVLQSIIKTYGDRDDYITKIVKRTREKLDEQEQERVKRLQSQKITVYQPFFGENVPRERANIDDYIVKSKRSVYDLNANPDDLKEMLSTLIRERIVNDGDVAVFDGEDVGYYADGTKFWYLTDFIKSRMEFERKRRDDLAKQEQERIEAEERQRQQEEEQRKREEEQRKKDEEKAKQKSAPKKKKDRSL
ncbi:MAG: relaxase/mobilization nuclease domain-containing protein [Ruminiclostridium sp.]|nr:relaxase/mobilization nuclease domain-containing protein [Ruminiclostridium sp.]